MNNEIHRHNTTVLNEAFDKKLEIDDLLEERDKFCENRQDALYWTILKLSANQMSVRQIYKLLLIIFRTREVQTAPKQAQKEIIREKFKNLSNLARSCKLSVQELLQHCPKMVYSKITELLILNAVTLEFIDQFVGLEFFQRTVLPQSYFYLILEGKLNQRAV